MEKVKGVKLCSLHGLHAAAAPVAPCSEHCSVTDSDRRSCLCCIAALQVCHDVMQMSHRVGYMFGFTSMMAMYVRSKLYFTVCILHAVCIVNSLH